MYTLGKKTSGYKGGSLRDRSTPQPSSLPKPSTQEDINNLLSSISNSYYEHAISKENLEYLTAYLTSFKNKENYSGDIQSTPVISRIILLIETLYADNKIENNHLDIFISGVQDVISNITPKVIVEKKPKEEINTGYSGGSARDRSTPQITFTPKVYGQQDVDALLTSVRTLYVENQLQDSDLEFVVEYLEEFKSTQNYSGNLTGNIIAGRLILTLEGMWADGKIDNSFLDLIIKGINDIKLNVNQKTSNPRIPKDQVDTGKYEGGSTRDRSTPQHQITTKTYTQKDIDDFVGSVSNSYYERAITKEDIYFVTHYLSAFADGGSYQGEYTSNSITYRLVSTVEGLLADGKIDTEYIKSIISGISLIPSTVVQREIKIVEPKEQLNSNKNYKK